MLTSAFAAMLFYLRGIFGILPFVLALRERRFHRTCRVTGHLRPYTSATCPAPPVAEFRFAQLASACPMKCEASLTGAANSTLAKFR
jgi:hypothetical protein